MYAKVIVDGPARETDRAFDYRIPPALRGWVDIGSRVGVPFGSRIVLGFVIDIRQRSEVDEQKLRDIERVLDLSPPLTPELVDLARWISQKYMCREISALQAMVPAALKAKYERVIQAAEEAGEPYASGMLLLPEEERIVA